MTKKNKTTEKADVTRDQLFDAVIEAYGKNNSEEKKDFFSSLLLAYVKQEVSQYGVVKNYNVLVLFDNTIMVKDDCDKIYKAVSSFEDKNKPLLLVLVSNGGEPGSAYLIGKLCREFSTRFVVVVPRHAKSAATLLSCAADEIHMGSLSELGPIDPQIDGMPALGLKNSIEHITELVNKNPDSGEMFARYLQRTIKPIQVGYYERVAESAVQYAEKLLAKKSLQAGDPHEIAYKLVYGYKDHGFVIDKEEASEIFGEATIKNDTEEYKIGNRIYEIFAMVGIWADLFDHAIYIIGPLDTKPIFVKRKKSQS